VKGINVLLTITAWISIVLAFGMAALQFSLICGAPFGEYALGGAHRVLPVGMRFISGFFACFFVVAGMAYMQRAGITAPLFSASFSDVLLMIYTLFLAYAMVGNGFLTKSKKEKCVMTPLSVIGWFSSVYVLFCK
jgi:hypothetical protein